MLDELPAPVAAILAPRGEVRVGQQVLFQDDSTNAKEYSWDFGDGSAPATTPSPLHTFTTPGPKTVTLTVSNRNGSATATVLVDVLPPVPVADFSFAPVLPLAGDAVQFTDQSSDATTWSWTFGDGTTSTVRNPQHTYATSGSFVVTLTVGNGAGDTSVPVSRTIEVDPEPPVITGIATTPARPEIGETVRFVISYAGVAENWQIDFGDNSDTSAPNNGAQRVFTHEYAASGTFPVTVTATGPSGSDVATTTVTVVDPPPPVVAITSVRPAAPERGEEVTIGAVARPRSGPIVSWSWTVDGAPVGGNSPTLVYEFPAAKTYTVVVTATGPAASDSDSRAIVVSNPPPPVLSSIGANPGVGTVGTPATFTPTVTGGVVTGYAWTVNGSAAGTGPTLTQTFTTPGTRTIGLTVTGPGGSSGPLVVPYEVFAPPSPAQPVANPPSATVGQTVTFTSAQGGGGPISSWAWLVDGVAIPGSGPSVAYAFAAAGTYDVTVVATGPSGATGRTMLPGYVVAAPPPPVAGFSAGTADLTVTVADASTGAITGWTWDFGDGTVVNSRTPAPHTYAAAGTYTVTLTVTGPGGTDSASQAVTVTAPPPPPPSSSVPPPPPP